MSLKKGSSAIGVLADLSEGDIVEELGYQQSYRRVLQSFGNFALVLAVASPIGGFLIISSYQIVYGGYWGLFWGWLIPAVIFTPQVLACAELCSSMPVNGANYWWTAALAPPKMSRMLSFVSGWTMVLQSVTSLASFAYAMGTSLSTLISILHPHWIPSNAQIMGISMSILIIWCLMSLLRMERLSYLFIGICSIVLLQTCLYIIALPTTHAVQGRSFATANDFFGNYTNYSDWNRPVSVPFTFFGAAWIIAGWNGPTFVVEETRNARVVSPRACVQTYATLAVLGLLLSIVSSICITDMDTLASDPTGLPLYTLLIDHWGTNVGVAFILTSSTVSVIGGASYVLLASSQAAAFARDGGLPFSTILSAVNAGTNMPINAYLLLNAGALLLLLLGLSPMASSIIFSLAVIASLIVLALPVGLRLFAGARFIPGPWNLGRWSLPVHAWAFASLCYMTIMESFPPVASWTAETFNYNWVVALGVILASLAGWFTFGHNFRGVDLERLERLRHTDAAPNRPSSV